MKEPDAGAATFADAADTTNTATASVATANRATRRSRTAARGIPTTTAPFMKAPSLNVALVWSLESPNDVIWTRGSFGG